MSCCGSKKSCQVSGAADPLHCTAIRNEVQRYYGKELQASTDLKITVCTTPATNYGSAARFSAILKEIHPQVIDKYYGCGVPNHDCLHGSRVLDLGCGSGRDCFVLSKLVGETGQVTGVDMTDEQLETAREFITYHTEKFGFRQPNVSFVKGFIEDLSTAGIPMNHYDIVISNCVVNLSPDKEAVFKEAFKALKEGGEFFFNDIYSDRRLSAELQSHKELWGECVAGALYWRDFLQVAIKVGFSEPRLVSACKVDIAFEEVGAKDLAGGAQFVSATYRLFKLPSAASVARFSSKTAGTANYKGTVDGYPDVLAFDYNTQFKVNEATALDYDGILFLQSSRYRDHFETGTGNEAVTTVKQVTMDPFEVARKTEMKD